MSKQSNQRYRKELEETSDTASNKLHAFRKPGYRQDMFDNEDDDYEDVYNDYEDDYY